MFTNLRNVLKLSLLAAFAALMMIPLSTNDARSQDWGPEDYCIPSREDNLQYSSQIYATRWCYAAYYSDYYVKKRRIYSYRNDYFGEVQRVRIETLDGTVLMDSDTEILPTRAFPGAKPYRHVYELFDDIPCYLDAREYWEENPEKSRAQLFSGGDYIIRVNTRSYKYGYARTSGYEYNYYCERYDYYYHPVAMRIWIDNNMNGDFEDEFEFINNDPMAPGAVAISSPSLDSPIKSNWTYGDNDCESDEWVYQFKAPDNIGTTRMRIMYGMANRSGYRNPSYSWKNLLGGGSYYQYYVQPTDKAREHWDNPPGSCWNGQWSSRYYYMYTRGETEDYYLEMVVPYKSTFPTDKIGENVLFAGELYNNETRLRGDDMFYYDGPNIKFEGPMGDGVKVEYWIESPTFEVVYRAEDAMGNTIVDASGIEELYFEYAQGKYAEANGGLKIMEGGLYTLNVKIHFPGRKPAHVKLEFYAAYENDLNVAEIAEPFSNKAPRFFKYPTGIPIEMIATYQNVGFRNITKFDAFADIYRADNDELVTTLKKKFDTTGSSQAPLSTGDYYTMDFPNFVTNNVGEYYVVFRGDLLNAPDNYLGNNRLFRKDAGAEHTFALLHEIEPAVSAAIHPNSGNQYFAGRPFRPILELKNLGVQDITNTDATVTIRDEDGNIVHEEEITVKDIPSGAYNTKISRFAFFRILEPGTYTATFTISNPVDGDLTNNELVSTFTVLPGLSNDLTDKGYYTIGQKFAGRADNFSTIQDALDALYLRGMSGDVSMQFTDQNYEAYVNERTGFPYIPEMPELVTAPIDLSTAIIGLGKENYVGENWSLTFEPHSSRAVGRALVNIHMYTYPQSRAYDVGYGIRFGQNKTWVNSLSVAAETDGGVSDELYRGFLNNGGNIKFTGGNKQSIRLVVHSLDNDIAVEQSAGAKAVYIGPGSQNITVENLLIESANPEQKKNIWLPQTDFSFTDGFQFDDDVENQTNPLTGEEGSYSYSAGIVNRGVISRIIMPDRIVVLDTVRNENIHINNNEIKQFGYGIVSLGIGPLINARTRMYGDFYNYNTEINHNVMFNLGRAGIVLGHERGAEVKFNQIFDVNGEYNEGLRLGKNPYEDAAGIILGDRMNYEKEGYNNVNIDVIGNSISDITGKDMVFGIKTYQSINAYVNPTTGVTYAPYAMPEAPGDRSYLEDQRDWLNVSSNAIWNINVKSERGHKYGVFVAPLRAIPKRSITNPKDAAFYAAELDNWLTPVHTGEILDEVTVANNTVILGDDAVNNQGIVAGIAVSQLENSYVYNNAVSITDPVYDSPYNAALLYNAALPGLAENDMQGNIFYVDKTKADIVRFFETDMVGNLINMGYEDEYNDIAQWQQWTGADMNSIDYYDPANEYMIVGNYPTRMIAKVANNQGSVLNNRGVIVENVKHDIYGAVRGSGNEKYDVGAIEFQPNIYKEDAEIVNIVKPGNWYAPEGRPFDDAQYIMTEAPVEVEYIIRNAGTNDDLNAEVTLSVEYQTPSGLWVNHSGFPEVQTEYVGLGQFKTVVWGLADGIGNEFVPMTYAELIRGGSAYNVPDMFKGMEHNVSPLYRITISTRNDENTINDSYSKHVRFHIEKSNISLVESREMYVDGSNLGSYNWREHAAYHNSAAVEEAFARMGYYTEWRDLEKDPQYDLDRLNRSGWEPRAVNYEHYRSVLWVDGHGEDAGGNPVMINRYQEDNIVDFLNSGSNLEKANFIAFSQELVRNNRTNGDLLAQLKVQAQVPYAPLVVPGNFSQMVSYDGKSVTGVKMSRDDSYIIEAVVGDHGDITETLPYPGLLRPINDGDGVSEIGMVYDEVMNDESPNALRVMAIGATTIDQNIALVGVDWRHFNNIELATRGVLDYIKTNDGTVVPVELLSFDATKAGERVDLTWVTASERGSSRFEVEKAIRTVSGDSPYETVATLGAAGYSQEAKNYGPVHDSQVSSGNTYVYRLKMVDADGTFDYSDERVVEFGSVSGLSIGAITPSPVVATSTMSYSIGSESTVSIEIYDITGKVVATFDKGTQAAGSYVQEINSMNMANGTYTVVLTSGNDMQTTQFTVVK